MLLSITIYRTNLNCVTYDFSYLEGHELFGQKTVSLTFQLELYQFPLPNFILFSKEKPWFCGFILQLFFFFSFARNTSLETATFKSTKHQCSYQTTPFSIGGIILLLEFNVCGLLYCQQRYFYPSKTYTCALPCMSAGILVVLMCVHKAHCGWVLELRL